MLSGEGLINRLHALIEKGNTKRAARVIKNCTVSDEKLAVFQTIQADTTRLCVLAYIENPFLSDSLLQNDIHVLFNDLQNLINAKPDSILLKIRAAIITHPILPKRVGYDYFLRFLDDAPLAYYLAGQADYLVHVDFFNIHKIAEKYPRLASRILESLCSLLALNDSQEQITAIFLIKELIRRYPAVFDTWKCRAAKKMLALGKALEKLALVDSKYAQWSFDCLSYAWSKKENEAILLLGRQAMQNSLSFAWIWLKEGMRVFPSNHEPFRCLLLEFQRKLGVSQHPFLATANDTINDYLGIDLLSESLNSVVDNLKGAISKLTIAEKTDDNKTILTKVSTYLLSGYARENLSYMSVMARSHGTDNEQEEITNKDQARSMIGPSANGSKGSDY